MGTSKTAAVLVMLSVLVLVWLSNSGKLAKLKTLWLATTPTPVASSATPTNGISAIVVQPITGVQQLPSFPGNGPVLVGPIGK